jgi:hypothetical protein
MTLRIFKCNLTHVLYNNMKLENEEGIQREQIIVLKLLEATISKDHDDNDFSNTNAIVTHQLCMFLSQELMKLCKRCNQLLREQLSSHHEIHQHDTPSSNNNANKEEDIDHDIEGSSFSSEDVEAIYVLIQLFGSITSFIGSLSDAQRLSLQETLRSEGLLKICIELLAQSYQTELSYNNKNNNKNIAKSNNNDSKKEKTTFSFKQHLVRIIGNLCYRNRKCQDEAIHTLYWMYSNAFYLFRLLSLDEKFGRNTYTIESL